jgi:hypothetical protein
MLLNIISKEHIVCVQGRAVLSFYFIIKTSYIEYHIEGTRCYVKELCYLFHYYVKCVKRQILYLKKTRLFYAIIRPFDRIIFFDQRWIICFQ